MQGYLSGFQCLVHNESVKTTGNHCLIHRQILAKKTQQQELQNKYNDNYRERTFSPAYLLAYEISLFSQNLIYTPFSLARSPFTVKAENVPETSQEEFTELINSDFAKTHFSSISISQFWIKCLKSYSVISETVLRLLLPFRFTYLCETGFSGLLFIKSEYNIRLDADDDRRGVNSQIIQRIPHLMKQQQDQPSH
ncbi:hypothetical protein RF11_06504 [Thelohanellus kitauei]|uniref:SCAN domain-containing protein 3 n=1 Tax=Thelohanellus kitauei TaxID=669202 RepID=A0A0C2N6F0_THEKT|nr:hypothetical protein RF11_06504 [Thelohanellus kitauei]